MKAIEDTLKLCNKKYNNRIIFKRIRKEDLVEMIKDYKNERIKFSKSNLEKQILLLSQQENKYSVSKSGQGEGINNILDVIVVEFLDWLDTMTLEVDYSKCSNLLKYMKKNKLMKNYVDNIEELRNLVNNNELYEMCKLYKTFVEWLGEVQTTILQEYEYNNNSQPTMMVPFSSELNNLISFTFYRIDKNSYVRRFQGVYIEDVLQQSQKDEYPTAISNKMEVQPFVLTDDISRLCSKSNFSQSGTVSFLRERIVNYVYRHYPIKTIEYDNDSKSFKDILTFTYPQIWNYMMKDKQQKKYSIFDQTIMRLLLLSHIFSQYIFVGFNPLDLDEDLCERLGISTETFFINNPFLLQNEDFYKKVRLLDNYTDLNEIVAFLPEDTQGNNITKIEITY